MSRSHLVLVCSLLAALGLVGIARVTAGDEADADAPVASAEPTGTAAALATAAPTAAATTPPAPADCVMSSRIAPGDTSPDVLCLETHLIAQGLLAAGTADQVYDATTETAVRLFQTNQQLVVDGVIGPQTAKQLGAWSGPDVLPPDPASCTPTGHSAVVDRFNQRAWLCADGAITTTMPMTSAWNQPDPGDYEVYAKDLNASSTLTGEYSTMTHFVAFTRWQVHGRPDRLPQHPQVLQRRIRAAARQRRHGGAEGRVVRMHPGAARRRRSDLGLARHRRHGHRRQLSRRATAFTRRASRGAPTTSWCSAGPR